MRTSSLRTIGLLALLLAPLSVFGQTNPLLPASSSPAQAPAAAPKNAVPADHLGRETPRGAVFGFIRAAQDENYSVAVQYFQPPSGRHRPSVAEEQDLAAQLLSILNEKFSAASLDALSRKPEGVLDDSLPPNQEMVAPARSDGSSFVLRLVRFEDEHGFALWFISRQTLDQVPDVYGSLHFARIQKTLPAFLVNHRPLAMPLWQWLAIILFIPLALGLAWLLAQIVQLLRALSRRLRGLAAIAVSRQVGPVTYLVAALLHYEFVALIGASLLYRQYYRRVIWVFLAAAFYWAATRVTRLISKQIGLRLAANGKLAQRSLVSLARRVLDVTMFVTLGLLVLNGMGVNVTAAIAGLGIGGLALGLGAQKTFENLLGGISILSDKALLVGDNCKIGDQIGIVEDIGLRSTKIRTADRTLVAIPNGTVATAVLENYSLRDKMLCRQIVHLRYDMSPAHLNYVLEQMRGVLIAHARVESKTARVRLLRFADYAFEVEIFAYILEREQESFLAEQENLILQIMQTLDRTGAGIALPSIASVVTQDPWHAPEKTSHHGATAGGSNNPAAQSSPSGNDSKT
ncbi:MAG: mechanosensitive ion channel domain-containing protein [Candidatus Acidiferrum sp.]|jgi:MscS family membrane protein